MKLKTKGECTPCPLPFDAEKKYLIYLSPNWNGEYMAAKISEMKKAESGKAESVNKKTECYKAENYFLSQSSNE